MLNDIVQTLIWGPTISIHHTNTKIFTPEVSKCSFSYIYILFRLEKPGTIQFQPNNMSFRITNSHLSSTNYLIAYFFSTFHCSDVKHGQTGRTVASPHWTLIVLLSQAPRQAAECSQFLPSSHRETFTTNKPEAHSHKAFADWLLSDSLWNGPKESYCELANFQ